ETEGITRIVTRLRPRGGGALQKNKNETAGDLGHLGLHAGSTPAYDRWRSGRGGGAPSGSFSIRGLLARQKTRGAHCRLGSPPRRKGISGPRAPRAKRQPRPPLA